MKSIAYLLSIAHKSPFSNDIPVILFFKVKFISIDAGLLAHTVIFTINIHVTVGVLMRMKGLFRVEFVTHTNAVIVTIF